MTKQALTPETAQVDDGVTLNCYSDSQSFTIVGVARGGRQIVIQRDNAVRSNQSDDTFSPGGFAGHTESPKGQLWDITPDPDGFTTMAPPTLIHSFVGKTLFLSGKSSGISEAAASISPFDSLSANQ